MVHLTVGNIGHLCVIISFVASLVASFAYFKASSENTLQKSSWLLYARYSFYIHALSVFGIIGCLYLIIYNHYYEYQYAWQHSSDSLPVYYMISCFWEGQEGSFLLWIFWHAVLGIVLISVDKKREAPVMAVFAIVQAFLCSMILGIIFFKTKIGSSPFILLRDAQPDLPVWKIRPDFVPTDGNGLNPTLQNYWMVIHPPTLFLGFASTLIPFAYCIAALWKKNYSEWIRPALPWVLFTVGVLGVGIMMGAYWAYETLNFGGYWSWDPVENAVYIPWLVMVATLHAMIIYRKNNNGLKTSVILAISTFILVLYATFLTRSGILGNSSVHSFTDLGLSGQLLIYLLFFLIISIVIAIVRWKYIPTSTKELEIYSHEFWILIGATILCLSSFQILASTSIPVYNKIGDLFGQAWNFAPPADPILHYGKIQLWFGLVITLLSSIGMFSYWKKASDSKFWQQLIIPLVISTLIWIALVISLEIRNFVYMALLLVSLFSLVANGSILIFIVRKNFKIAGGSIAHIGVAMMLIGILFSAGYSKVVSLNRTGALYSKQDFFTQNNGKETKENTMLWVNKPEKIDQYLVTYRGRRIEPRNMPGYLRPNLLNPTQIDYKSIANEDIIKNGKTYYKKGDTVETFPENTYYEVEYRDDKGKIFSLFPRAQINEKMGPGILASPDIHKEWFRDVYTHVSSVPDPKGEKNWSNSEIFTASLKDTFFINDYVAILENVTRINDYDNIKFSEGDAAVKATVKILTEEKNYTLSPVFIIKNQMVGSPVETDDDLGIKISLTNIDPKEGKFTFKVNTSQKDYIIMKAMEKPLINLLWIGVLLIAFGVGLSLFKRIKDVKENRDA